MKKSFNQILDNPINTKNYLLICLIAASFLLRILAVYFVKDTHIDNEWNVLLNNLTEYKSFSFYTFNNELIPSVLMPPMYAFFLYLVKIITFFDGNSLLYAIIFTQVILSTYSVYLFYKINQYFFSNHLSLINSTIFSILPLNIYACGQISSINLQITFSLFFLNSLFLIIKKETNRNIIIFSIISGLLFLTRGEFILIFFLIYFFIIWKNKLKLINLIKIAVVVTLIISPYLLRNYIHFNQFFLVKSLGYNLWKGNNEFSNVDGYENLSRNEFSELKFKINNVKKNKYYEINRDDIFLNEAKKNLSKDTFRYIKLFFKKITSYYFIDINSNYPNYYNFFHYVPILFISILSLPGLFIFYKKSKFENKCLSLYFFSNLIIFSIFFILPRYKLIILPIQIILAAYLIQYLVNKLKKN